jgi:protein-L-isoaspartate(D-aspartate) O-methyltransferase
MMAASTSNVPNDAFLTDARNRMVDSQIRPNKVSDPRILDAMRHLPRERFLPAALLSLAYADQNVPLGGGRVMLQPMALARLVHAAAPSNGDKALVVGAGAGYSAALLASLGCEVTALEPPGMLLDNAKQVLADLAPSVTLITGALPPGWAAGGPYDVILIDGAVTEVPATVANQLKRETGRLVTILMPNGTGRGTGGGFSGNSHCGVAVQAESTPAGISVRALFDFTCPVLPAFVPAPLFAF